MNFLSAENYVLTQDMERTVYKIFYYIPMTTS